MSLSGLAAKIRSTDGLTDAETFDLAGKDPTTIANAVTAAFAKPFENNVRLTFITGAGKLERQKYHEALAKTVTAALKEHGYEEGTDDPGTFKMQHDTNKNLKTVVVSPKLAGCDTADGDVPTDAFKSMGVGNGIRIPGNGSPVYMVSVCSENVFEKMIASKIQSWSQKKTCGAIFEEIAEIVQALQDSLFKGEPLSDPQQEFYDTVSLDTLALKAGIVKKSMAAQVESGSITKEEKAQLLEQVSSKLSAIEEEIGSSQGKPKKLAKLTETKQKLKKREEMLGKITPQPPHKLKNEVQIMKLRTEMRPLEKLEAESRGRLLSIKETSMLTRKTEIEEEIVNLENSSREWFEGDDSFAVRVQASRDAAAAKRKQAAKKKTPGAGVSKSKPVTKWVTPGANKPGYWGAAPKKKPTASKPQAGKSGGMFAAMMDSDSDSD
uniref:Uncharacterized protein n=1 Tax=Leptocylindrus danicus TaxID=163516 RepID=A0A7S2JSB7_9STRA|mmetsp:Transcript_10983/g.16581  ORF Transcript_10983/g.16581 Transcript_10983/m.16581 type:complete len:437 (+) Transcript_10983:162-1472(+)